MPASTRNPAADFVLRSRAVVTPDGVAPAAIVVRSGKIEELRPYDSSPADLELRDAEDAAVLPGLVDPHVHLNEPGRTEWEGFATGTAAAAAGGVTTLVDMPLNSSPVTTSLAALHEKRAAAGGKLSVDVGFHAGLIPGNADQLPALLEAGVLGVKAFLCHSGIDEFPAANEADLRAAMPLIAERGSVLLAHAEISSDSAPTPSDPGSYQQYAASRPASFERQAIELLIELCRKFNCRTHIVHLADAGSLPLLKFARAKGLPLTVETCPHYLTFAAEEIPDGATQYKCAPPIRDVANREGLWQGLADGVIDLIATDHSPCPPSLKRLEDGDFTQAWGGVSSLQIGLPAVWTEAHRRGHSLEQVVEWLSAAPARLVGIKCGILPGADANLVVFDSDATFTVRGEQLLHRHKLTPYEGRDLRGVVRQTLLRGRDAAAGEGRTL
ncbi:Allantoinase [Posidoniimonas polymericola]|uniref:allantoinase n=1 Tax=Posidoniimonas polymericola TaxID=2528002 RepID=A0A5C5YMB4_9BACT|nr:allantoinase AllB [Posidoniimonas polymericola]TWT76111.1 Allantoinase [Posidoniimonas polymericola]